MHVIKNSDIGYLKRMLFNEAGEFQVLPYADLKDVPQEHLSQLCVQHGLYCIPTAELIAFLKEATEEQVAIEIGSGNGVIGRTLNIPSTDSFMQADGGMQLLYLLQGQAPVRYGANVYKFDALRAVRQFKPDIVIAAWVTHKYREEEHWREGNMYGVDENQIIQGVEKYIFVGNEGVHGKKPILDLPHRIVKAEWLLSRSLTKDKNVIWIWGD